MCFFLQKMKNTYKEKIHSCSRKTNILQILNHCNLLCCDVNQLIAEYDAKEWKTSSEMLINLTALPYAGGFLVYQQQIYVCSKSEISIYNMIEKTKIRKNLHFVASSGFDINQQKKVLYIADENSVFVINLDLCVVSSWRTPCRIKFGLCYLKSDGETLYLSISRIHKVFACNSNNGQVLQQFGSGCGSQPNQFDLPLQLTANGKTLYVCDTRNHRVQVLEKNNGTFFTQWVKGKSSTEKGQFYCPYSIYYHISENIFYVGDNYSVQLFTNHNDNTCTCLQRLNEVCSVRSIGVDDSMNRLYVLDMEKEEISMFQCC